MAYTTFLSLGLCILVLFHGSLASQQENYHQQWQAHRSRAKTECNIQRLNAQEPNNRIESEGGVTEFWDQNNEEFECAGVAAVRHTLEPKSMILPSYSNTPKLIYVVQGRGFQGTVIPGCAETYESESSQSSSSSSTGGDRRRRDRHQKIRQFREGDVIALPAGVAYWAYNDGDVPLVSVSLLDTSNHANQLDHNFRRFFLAGNPQGGRQEHGQEERGRGQGQREQGRGQGQRQHQQQNFGNIFRGFNEQLLAEAFNVEVETARKLEGREDQRGSIVRVEKDLQVVIPQWEEQQEREREHEGGRGRPNGFEETLCTLRLTENIADPTRADVYNPRGGRIRSLNSLKLPILNWLQLSAERGVLYNNAILAPHWNLNAHSMVYILRGSGRLQIVGNSGKSVFDDEVREGQIIIVPQNFAAVKKAGPQGLEWVSFKTDDEAMTSPIAGRLSAIRGMPEEVLMNSYDISREDARNIKYNRDELTVFGPGSRSQKRESA